MTRDEWKSKNVANMIYALRQAGYTDADKPRQLACWSANRVRGLLTDTRSREAIVDATAHIAGHLSAADLARGFEAAGDAAQAAPADSAQYYAAIAAQYCVAPDALEAAAQAADAAATAWERVRYGTAYTEARAQSPDESRADRAASRAADAARAEEETAQADELRELIPWDAVAPLFAEPATA